MSFGDVRLEGPHGGLGPLSSLAVERPAALREVLITLFESQAFLFA